MAANKFTNRAFVTLEAALVVADLNPLISEPIRLGTLFGVQAFTHNVLLSAVSFGGVTLLLDMIGAVATADLLARKRAREVIAKTHNLAKKLGVGRVLTMRTTFLSDLGITLLIGTPFTLIHKQHQDPERSYEANLSLGVILSALAALGSAVQGGAIVAGLWHPTAPTVVLALLALASIIATERILKKRFS